MLSICEGKGLNCGAYRQLSNNLRSGFISEFRYEDLDLAGSFDGEGGYGMSNIRGSESDLVGIGAVHSQWPLTRYNNVLLQNCYIIFHQYVCSFLLFYMIFLQIFLILSVEVAYFYFFFHIICHAKFHWWCSIIGCFSFRCII